ncbi:MAG: thioredoxin family protein [Armatimonadota bacterium]
MKKITVYGPGCAKCKQTEELVRRVVAESGVEAEVEKISDIQQIVIAGILSTPGVAVDGVIKSTGRVPKPEEVKDWISQ